MGDNNRIPNIPKDGQGTAAIEVMSAIHSGPDGYVALASRQGDTWMELGAIELTRLGTMFPAIANWLVKDSYFSLSSFFTQQVETLKDGNQIPYTNWHTDLPTVHRTRNNLRWLNVCFADIDQHGGGDFASLMADVIRLQDIGQMPPASILCRSGRGLWLFWLLHGIKDSTKPQPAFSDKIELFARVQHGISKRLQDVGLTVDVGCTSPTTLARVPGSINTLASLSHQRVKYWFQIGGDRRPYSYSLYDLAAAFDVPLRRSFPLRSEVNPEVSEVKRRGWRKRWENSWGDFLTVRALRGHFKEKTRTYAVLLQSILLRRLGRSEQEIERAALELGDDCHPPLPQWKSRRTAKDSRRCGTYYISHSKCMKLLQVTRDEAVMLSHWPHPGRELKGRKVARETRRDVIRTVVDNLGYVPSSRQMVVELAKRGIRVSHVACWKDFDALGIEAAVKPTRAEILPPLFAVTKCC